MNLEQRVTRIEHEILVVTRLKELWMFSSFNKWDCDIDINSTGTKIRVIPSRRVVELHYVDNGYSVNLIEPEVDPVRYVFPDIPVEDMKPDATGGMVIHNDWTAVPRNIATYIYRFLSGQATARDLVQ